jgi:hypothetical protein
MSFPDHIDHLFRTGKIQRQFRVADVEQHLRGTFAPNYIKTGLANFAKDTGN